jgi:hypothetical protein
MERHTCTVRQPQSLPPGQTPAGSSRAGMGALTRLTTEDHVTRPRWEVGVTGAVQEA